MKTFELIRLLIILSFVSVSYGQSPYYHSIQLKSKTQVLNNVLYVKEDEASFSILASYVGIPNPSKQDIIKEFQDNPFFKLAGGAMAATDLFTKQSSSMPFFSDLNVTTLADGIAKFLVERVKQELSITFFDRFKKDLEQSKDLQILFPNTYNVLMNIDTDIYNFTAYIEMLREAFISDFQVMIPDLRKLINDPRYEEYFKQNPKLKSIFDIGLLIADDIHNGIHPGEIVKHLAEDSSSLIKIDANLNASVQVLNLFIQSFRSKDPNRYLVSSDSINILLRDTVSFKIYLGLIYQKGLFIKFKDKNNNSINFNEQMYKLYHFSESIKDNWVEIKNILEEIVYKTEYAHNAFIKIKEKNKNPDPDNRANYKDYYVFYDASLNLIEYVSDIPKLLKDPPPITYLNKEKYFYAARKLGVAYLDINNKRYASVILNLAEIYDSIIIKKEDSLLIKPCLKIAKIYCGIMNYNDIQEISINITTIINALKQLEIDKTDKIYILLNSLDIGKRLSLLTNLNNQEIQNSKDLLSTLKKIRTQSLGVDSILKVLELSKSFINDIQNQLIVISKDNTKNKRKALMSLIKYGNFAANIAKAETSDDVKNAIESVALPAGSSRIKRESNWNFSLNAYVGPFAGNEYIKGSQNSNWFNSYGIAAPVGIAFSKGNIFTSNQKYGGKSLTAFVSLIDVGALVSYRFRDDSAAIVPDIKLKDIISPGLFISYGLGKTPLSLSVGYQIGPLLRNVASSRNVFADNKYSRWSVSLTVDIPIFNLYTKPK
jgi:hypothetical protein